jgi:hypothetical protein
MHRNQQLRAGTQAHVARILFEKYMLFVAHEHPVVLPHVSHLRHVPFRTIVKFWHSGQASPS